MYAVVEIAGMQFQVQPNEVVKVPLLDGQAGDSVTFDNILLTSDGSNVNVGNPYVKGTVSAKILAHGKDSKVLIFKKIRRKGFRKLNGHRQHFTKIEITGINA